MPFQLVSFVVILMLQCCLVHRSSAFFVVPLATTKHSTSSSSWLQQHPTRRTHTQSTQLQAVWSDMKAVQDYQNFLASGKQEVELTNDMPSVIIASSNAGASSELAECLQVMGMGDDCLMTPQQELPNAIGGSQE